MNTEPLNQSSNPCDMCANACGYSIKTSRPRAQIEHSSNTMVSQSYPDVGGVQMCSTYNTMLDLAHCHVQLSCEPSLMIYQERMLLRCFIVKKLTSRKRSTQLARHFSSPLSNLELLMELVTHFFQQTSVRAWVSVAKELLAQRTESGRVGYRHRHLEGSN